MQRVTFLFLVLSLLMSDCLSQETAQDSANSPPKDLGLYLLFGGIKSNLSDFNSSMQGLGFDEANEFHFSTGFLFNFLETEKFSYSVLLDMIVSQTLSRNAASENGARSFKLYGASFVFSYAGTISSSQVQRLQLLIGMGVSWSFLTAGQSQSYEDFVNGSYVSNDDLNQYFWILRPAIRYEYWLDFLSTVGPIGIMAGYSFPFVNYGWTNSSTPFLTQGFEIHNAPRTSLTGFFLTLQLPLITYSQN